MADNKKYFTLLTDKGRFKIAAAAADNGEVKITHLAIGDGGGQETNPVPSQTELLNEVWRTPVEAVETDPKNLAAVLVSAIIPHDTGGWWMREFGIFDVDNDLLAVVKPVPAYKAVGADGQLEDIYYQFQLVIGEQAQVVVIVDPSVLWATRDYVNTRRIGAWQLANTPWLPVIAMDVQTPPASPRLGDTYLVPTGAKGDWKDKAGQLAQWLANKWLFIEPHDGHGFGLPDGRIFIRINGVYVEKTANTVSIIAGKGLTGGGKLTEDRTIELSPDILAQITNSVIPTGAIQAFAMQKLPANWVECNGQALSRKDYSALFAAIGTIWGAGDGSTTFNVPDFRGVFLRGFDNGRGVDGGRKFAAWQQDDFKKHYHPGSKTRAAGGHSHKYDRPGHIKGSTGSDTRYDVVNFASDWRDTSWADDHFHVVDIAAEGGTETRPINLTVVYAIKA